MQQVLPDTESVYEMLNLLLGDDMTVEYRKMPVPTDKGYAAIYVNKENEPKAICVCDIAFAAFSGGAMTMMPPNSCKDAVDDEELSEMLVQNLYEVMNICTRLVIDDETPHLRLTELKPAAEVQDIIETLLAEDNRGDYIIDIPKYGKGLMTFIVS